MIYVLSLISIRHLHRQSKNATGRIEFYRIFFHGEDTTQATFESSDAASADKRVEKAPMVLGAIGLTDSSEMEP